jgi:hypothetical protein
MMELFMAKHIVMALTNPVEGREAEYDTWFEGIHIQEMLTVPGFLSAQRYEAAGSQIAPGQLPYRFITAYEVETDDLPATLTQLGAKAQSATKTDTSDLTRRALWVYAPKGPKRLPK